MLMFEINRADERVEIHADRDGLRALIASVEAVLAEAADPASMKPAHTHLMTLAWAGRELDDEPQGGGELVNHVKIYRWDDQ